MLIKWYLNISGINNWCERLNKNEVVFVILNDFFF